MIPQQTPVKNHWGNNSNTIFDFDFYIENEEQLLVTHTDFDGNVTYPTLGVDYQITQVGNIGGSSIEFPIAGSTYSTLGWNESTDEKELLSIALSLPIEQPAEYSMSGDLNKNNLEYSFDYLTRICQIIYRTLERTMRVSESDADFNMTLPQPKANNVFKWTEDEKGLENYDIIGENNTFKTNLLSDIAAAQQSMSDTINANKTATDEEIADFKSAVNSDLEQKGQNLQTQLDDYKQRTDQNLSDYQTQVNQTLQETSTSLQTQLDEFRGTTTQEIATFEENTNSALGSMRDDLDDTMTSYQTQINGDIDNFKSSVRETISTVEEAAEKVNELEDAVNTAVTKADEVSQKATAVENLAIEVSQKADEVMNTAENLANKSLSNLNATGQAVIDAKADKTTVNSLSDTVETNRQAAEQAASQLENNLANEKAGLIILIKGKADEETMRLIHNGMYEGVNLETKFAEEIAGYSSVYSWLDARAAAGDYNGIYVRDTYGTNIKAGTVAGYSLAAQNFTMRIMGINHYKNCGDTPMGNLFTCHSDQVIDTPIKWQPTDNNNGTSTVEYPWLASAAYAILNGKNNYDNTHGYNKVVHGANANNAGVLQLLPADLQAVIKDTRALLDKRYSASGLLTYSTNWAWENRGKLHLPTETEVYGHQVRSNLGYAQGYWNPEEGLSNQLEGYKGVTAHRLKYNSAGSRCTWWLGSPASYNSASVCSVFSHGFAGSLTATNATIYLPLCFCI